MTLIPILILGVVLIGLASVPLIGETAIWMIRRDVPLVVVYLVTVTLIVAGVAALVITAAWLAGTAL